MAEKEPSKSRYEHLEEYHPTIPWSAEAGEKAATYLMMMILNPPDEPLPDSFYLLYNDEPKALEVDFIAGKIKETDVRTEIIDGESNSHFLPTGTTFHFPPETNPLNRLQYLENIHKALSYHLENSPPKNDARTN